MPGRSYSSPAYRYGFNGQEKDDEVDGGGNTNTAEYWEYDCRLGRRWNADPLNGLTPGWTPYRSFFCSPLYWSDPSGLFETRKDAKEYKKEHKLHGRVKLNQDGSYSIDNRNDHTSTYKDEYGLIRKASLIEAKRPDDKNLTPWGLGVEWLSGKGAKSREFNDGDYITEMYKLHSHVSETRQMVISQLNQSNGQNAADGSNPYELKGIEGVGKYVKDYSTLATGGLTGNIVYTYLGSHSLQYSITCVDVERRIAEVTFLVHNTSTMQSATRPPVIGYQKWYANSIGKLTDGAFKSGAGSETEQWIEWTETIKW